LEVADDALSSISIPAIADADSEPIGLFCGVVSGTSLSLE
jgi:hypothetical protein